MNIGAKRLRIRHRRIEPDIQMVLSRFRAEIREEGHRWAEYLH